MRRLLGVLVVGFLLIVANGVAAAAAPRPPSDLQGTYNYRDGGYSITVGYICPGLVTIWGIDPYPNYAAQVRSNRATVTITRHAAWKLDISMQEVWGAHLTPKAYDALAEAAATANCS